MDPTIRSIRIFFFILCVIGAALISYSIPDWDQYRWSAIVVGAAIGALVILVDILLKGFSLRGLSALTFGLFAGWAAAQLIATSPFFSIPFDQSDAASVVLAQNMYLVRIGLFVILMYLGAVIALRGKDEFNLVIPYVRFVPHGVDVPLVVVDTSALIDGRLAGICESRFLGYGLVIPRFVLDELQNIADSQDPDRQMRGRKGLDTLNKVRSMPHVDLRINESSVSNRQKVDAKLIFLAQSLKAKLLTTDYNLAQLAEFHNLQWLNLNALAKAMNPDLLVGDTFSLKLTKAGKDAGQAVGFLTDGSMVVVANARDQIGQTVRLSVDSILPSAGGKMIFARLLP
jgi:uncharacterized protein YacL